MSTAFYIALEEEVDFDTFVDGKAVARATEAIADLCASNKIKAIDDFLSQDPSEFIEDFELPDDFEIQWYDAQDGIDYFSSLISLISSNDCTFNKQDVFSDLNGYVSVLKMAREAGLKWHLELDI